MSEALVLPTIKCTSCGNENSSNLVYCGYCGDALSRKLVRADSATITQVKRTNKTKKPGRFLTWTFGEGEIARKLSPEEVLNASTSGSKGYIIPEGLYSLVFEEGSLISEGGPGKYTFLSESEEKILNEVYTRRTDGVIHSIGNTSKAIKRFLVGVSPKDIEQEKLNDYDYLLNHLASNRSLSIVIARTTAFITTHTLNRISSKDTEIDVNLSLSVGLADMKLVYEQLLFDRVMITTNQLQSMLFEANNGSGGYFASLIQSFKKYTTDELQNLGTLKQNLLLTLRQQAPKYLEIKDILTFAVSKPREAKVTPPVSLPLELPEVVQEKRPEPEVAVVKQAAPNVPQVEPAVTPAEPASKPMLALEFKPTKELDRPSVPDSESFFQKGLSYEKGIDTEKDTISALEWYRKAADLGHEEAMLRIQLLQPKHPPAYVTEYPGYTKETLDLLSSSLAGDSAAQFKLGLRYSNGKGAPKDSTEAVKWYLKSAEQGEPAAMNNLALKYKAGDGVEKNITEAFKWCLKSANKGFGIAQFNLADFYEKGIGVAADLNLAIEWHKKAAAQGEKDSILKLQKLGSAPKPAFQNYLDQAKSVLN